MARSATLVKTRQRRGNTALIAVILLLVFGWLVSNQGNATNFATLPALQTADARDALMLSAATDNGRILIAGEQGHILYSDDSGSSWTHADVPISLAITAVTFSSAGQAWATAHDGYLLNSKDNGESWQTVLTGIDVARLSVMAAEQRVQSLEAALEEATPETREDLEWALEDATFAVDDATAATEDGVTTPLLNVWFANESEGYAMGAYGVFLHTTDGGATWTPESNRLENPDKYHLYGLARSAAGTLLVAGEAGTVLRSLDGGQSFESAATSYAGSFFGTVAGNDGSLLLYGLRGNVFRSTDEGDSWSPIDTGDQRTLMGGMVRKNGEIILVGSAGIILRSVDHGQSFTVIPTTGNRAFSSVTESANGRLVLVGFGGVSFTDAPATALASGSSHE